jgi:predicted acyl esterase
VDRNVGLVWSASPMSTAKFVRGTPRVHLRLASSSTAATVFAYLYEVSPVGLGALMSVQPYTATQLTPGVARSVTFDLQPIAWTTRAGDHLVLVLDTADPRFGSVTPFGSMVTVSSTGTDPATLSVPLAG